MARVRFMAGADFFIFTVSGLALGPTQPPIECLVGSHSPGIKWPGHKADHSPPSNAKAKNGGAIINHRDNFTFQVRKCQCHDGAVILAAAQGVLCRGDPLAGVSVECPSKYPGGSFLMVSSTSPKIIAEDI
jgi:hypothetical protein